MDHAKRDLRVDLSTIDNATARELLATYRPIVRGIAATCRRDLRRSFFTVTLEDLHAIGDAAVLEAYLLHRADRAGLPSWVRRIVGWRIRESLWRMRRLEPSVACRKNGETLQGLEHEALEVAEYVQRSEVISWFRAASAELPARQRLIVNWLWHGETQSEIARSLGISSSRVMQEVTSAFEALRASARAAGIDGLGMGNALPPEPGPR